MMNALLGNGYTIEKLAQKLEISVASVNRMKAGRQTPSYPLGVKIEALYRQVEGSRNDHERAS